MSGVLPQTLGDGYRLIQQLEGAGLGRVFVASLKDQAIVAVKVFDATDVSEDTEEAWKNACEALIAVRHTGLSGTVAYGVDEDTGQRFLVQELVSGITLSQLRRMLRRPLEPVEAATFLLPIANALVYCHSRGVTHGRLTADHILIADGPETRTRLVGLRPHGPEFYPTDNPDWQASTEDPEHGDVLGLAAVAHFLTFGPGGEGPELHPHDLDAVSFHGEDPAWDRILAEVLGDASQPMSVVELRDMLLRVVADNDSQRKATRQMGAEMARANAAGAPELSTDITEVAELVKPPPRYLTVPHQIYRRHDGPIRMLVVMGLAVALITGFAIAAGGLGPG